MSATHVLVFSVSCVDVQVVTSQERRVAATKFEYSMLDEIKPVAQVLTDIKLWIMSLVRKVQSTRGTATSNAATQGVVVAKTNG